MDALLSTGVEPLYRRRVTYCCAQSSTRLINAAGACLERATDWDTGRRRAGPEGAGAADDDAPAPAAAAEGGSTSVRSRAIGAGPVWDQPPPPPAAAAAAATAPPSSLPPSMDLPSPPPSPSSSSCACRPSAAATGSSARSMNACPPPAVANQCDRARLQGAGSCSATRHSSSATLCVSGSSHSGLAQAARAACSTALPAAEPGTAPAAAPVVGIADTAAASVLTTALPALRRAAETASVLSASPASSSAE